MTKANSRPVDSVRSLLMFLVHHVESSGVASAQLKKEARLSNSWIEATNLDDFVTVVPRLIKAAVKLTRDDLLLLHAGEKFHFCLGGLGGFAAIHAPTPGLAVETFGRYSGVEELLKVTISSTEDETSFAYNVTDLWPKPTREQLADGFLSCTATALRAVCRGSCTPIYARLARPEPDCTTEFRRALRCEVTFGADRNQISFNSEDLASPSPQYDQLLYEQLRFAADLRADEPSAVGPVRQLVEQALRGGADTITEVAELLRMNSRTLQRRLQTEGTSFRETRSQVRVDMAEQLLRETSMSLPEISGRLNYTDEKALRKAIKRVTGMTPSELRKR